MKDEARWDWKHFIAGKKSDIIDGKKINRGVRISVTFRKIKKFPPSKIQKEFNQETIRENWIL